MPSSLHTTSHAVWAATSAAVCAAWIGVAAPCWAGELEQPLSPEMRAIEVDEVRGRMLEGGLTFKDHHGQTVRLSDFVDGERPVLLTLNYFRCRVVCSVQLSGLGAALGELDWTAGDENFRMVTVSIDPSETPEDAAKKRATVLKHLGRGEDVDWQFLTGNALTIKTLAAQLGIRYAYDAEQDQYAHPAVAMFLAPDGRIMQYLYGLTFAARDLKLALLEAGQGKVGTPMEKLYQSCFSYDPHVGRYGPFAFGIMRLGAALTILLVATTIVTLWRFDRRKTRAAQGPSPDSKSAEALT